MGVKHVLCACVAVAGLLAPAAVRADPFNNSAQTISGFGAVSAAQGSAIRDLQNHVLSSAIEASGAAVFPSARIRKTWHEGYTGIVPPVGVVPQKSNPYDSTEESVFVTAFTTLPSQYFGGKVRLGAFVGYDHLDVNMQPVSFSFNGEQFYYPSRADNQSVIFGGYALYSHLNNYAMMTLSGALGETDQNVTCIPPQADPAFCQFLNPPLKPFSYDTRGVIASLVGGHVVDFGRSAVFDTLKLDLRAGTTVQYMEGSKFLDAQGMQNRPELASWGGSFAATLFAIINASSGATIRPYAKGEFRNSFYYDLTNHVVDQTQCVSGCDIRYWQKSDMAIGEVGVGYSLNNFTVNAAVYGETAADQRSVGGRLGVTFKTGAPPPPAKASESYGERPAGRKGPGAGAAAPSWAGLYYGFNGGYGWSAHDSVVTAQFFSLNNNALEEQSRAFGSRGTFGGVQLGYNWAVGKFVFGLESDVEGSQIHGSGTAEVSEIANARLNGNRVKAVAEPDWFGTLRARLGYSFDRTLVFATAGLAVGEMEDRIIRTRLGTGNDPGTKIDRETKPGYVLGAGMEHYFASNWSFKGEYQYLNFGDNSVTFVDTLPGPNPIKITNGTVFDHSYHTFRLGVNYHLGASAWK